MKLNRKERQTRDLALIEKIRAGDVVSLERLIDRYLPQLIGFFHYLRAPESMVEDLAQETFEKVIRKLDSYDDKKAFSSWLMTIGRNLYFDECRRENRKRERQRQIEFQQEPIPSPEEQIVVRETASELLHALKPEEKFLVELRVFQNMPFAEIAENTGENVTTLRSRFFRIMGRLRLTVKDKKVSTKAAVET